MYQLSCYGNVRTAASSSPRLVEVVNQSPTHALRDYAQTCDPLAADVRGQARGLWAEFAMLVELENHVTVADIAQKISLQLPAC